MSACQVPEGGGAAHARRGGTHRHGKCANCGIRWARYTVVSPETGQIMKVCNSCEIEWARLPERRTLTEWELTISRLQGV